MTKMHELADLGQAIWFDYIRRSFITSGELQRLVEQGVRDRRALLNAGRRVIRFHLEKDVVGKLKNLGIRNEEVTHEKVH